MVYSDHIYLCEGCYDDLRYSSWCEKEHTDLSTWDSSVVFRWTSWQIPPKGTIGNCYVCKSIDLFYTTSPSHGEPHLKIFNEIGNYRLRKRIRRIEDII